MKRVYVALLNLYPVDCRAWCGPEMLDAFETAVEERSGFTFAVHEFGGLFWGAAEAWFAKLTCRQYLRGFWAPTKMRPAGTSWEEWYRPGARVLADVIEAQRRGE
jgi:hypothetical protein